jgi:hypothetical protein
VGEKVFFNPVEWEIARKYYPQIVGTLPASASGLASGISQIEIKLSEKLTKITKGSH